MFLSRWTLFQGIIIILLVILAFIADIFKSDAAIPINSNNEPHSFMLWMILFFIVVNILLSLIMYFQTKKSETFLMHRLWDKAHILMPVLFVLSLIVIMVLFIFDPINQLIQVNRWIMYLLLYYLLFLFNLIILAIVNKVKGNTTSNGNKIKISFVWTSVILLIVNMVF